MVRKTEMLKATILLISKSVTDEMRCRRKEVERFFVKRTVYGRKEMRSTG